MNKAKVIKVNADSIEFDNGFTLSSNHNQDCCENHYLSFSDLTILDFEGLEFNLENEEFFKRVDGYGIELFPLKGHSVRVPGYGYNNGYYSSQLDLILSNVNSRIEFKFDISDCQNIEG